MKITKTMLCIWCRLIDDIYKSVPKPDERLHGARIVANDDDCRRAIDPRWVSHSGEPISPSTLACSDYPYGVYYYELHAPISGALIHPILGACRDLRLRSPSTPELADDISFDTKDGRPQIYINDLGEIRLPAKDGTHIRIDAHDLAASFYKRQICQEISTSLTSYRQMLIRYWTAGVGNGAFSIDCGDKSLSSYGYRDFRDALELADQVIDCPTAEQRDIADLARTAHHEQAEKYGLEWTRPLTAYTVRVGSREFTGSTATAAWAAAYAALRLPDDPPTLAEVNRKVGYPEHNFWRVICHFASRSEELGEHTCLFAAGTAHEQILYPPQPKKELPQ